ncbi:MAG: 16S rRNA (cytidine(1402)-2'-O)-methyltransferase [Pseudomonadota bacterium]
MTGRLDIVATPIGNLQDASPRMRESLAAADVVVVEDTRHSGRLLSQFGIKKPLFVLHEHNEQDVVETLLDKLRAGERIALICDAGTPAISDPGFRLVRAARAGGLQVSPVPGPSAVIAALSAGGLPTDRFAFEGFLPAKASARATRLQALATEPRTLVFYESVHRVEDMLIACSDILGAERPAVIARELTKMHEQIVSGDLASLRHALATGEIPLKGEFVVLIGGGTRDADLVSVSAEQLLAALLAESVPLRQAARAVAAVSGYSRNALYQAGLSLQSSVVHDEDATST